MAIFAEGVGFEPTRHTPTGFQDQHHRPLGQPSRTDPVATLVHRPEDCATRGLLPSGLVPLRPPGSASDALLRLRPEACRTRTVGRSELKCVTVGESNPTIQVANLADQLHHPRFERVAASAVTPRDSTSLPSREAPWNMAMRLPKQSWRSERDLNPRYPQGVYHLSRVAQ